MASDFDRLFFVLCFSYVFFLGFLFSHAKAEPKFPLDFDDTDFYLTSRKGGPPSAVIEDIRRGQEGVLVKLRQVTNELENDELKLNNIFYKLGHHDTELKSINNGIGKLTTSGRKIETKLNKHAFNVEFLHRQVKEIKTKLEERDEDKMQIMSLQKTVDHLEDRLSETLYRLSNIENASTNKSVSRSAEPGVAQYEFIAQPSALLNYPLRDEGACLEGWQLMEGFCFLIETKKKTFKEAISSCASKKAQLVSLTEAKKNLFIRKILNSDIKYWTSGTDIFSPTQWSFLLSGDPIPKEMWANPFKGYMNSRINHHCALIAKNGLEAINCGHKFSYICEKL